MENKTVVLVPPGNVGKHMRESLKANENIVVVDAKPCDKTLNAFTGEYVDMDKMLREFIKQRKLRTNLEHCTGRKSDRKRNRKTRWS